MAIHGGAMVPDPIAPGVLCTIVVLIRYYLMILSAFNFSLFFFPLKLTTDVLPLHTKSVRTDLTSFPDKLFIKKL